MAMTPLYGAVEAGGTKFVCLVGSDPDHVIERRRIETATPQETLARVAAFFEPYVLARQIRTIGVGAFGPLNLDVSSPDYGCITATPKVGWQNTNIAARLGSSLQLAVALDTDVNAAALGEATWGAGRGTDGFLYLTIGTGIGGGVIRNGKPWHGMSHPEMGHIRIPHNWDQDPFAGGCPFHKDCLEGLASGPAIERRFGHRAELLPDDHPFWDTEAGYIGLALASYVLILSPTRIILGGGIMQRRLLMPMIQRRLLEALGSYIQIPAVRDRVQEYVVLPQLGSDSGVFGALELARQTEIANLAG